MKLVVPMYRLQRQYSDVNGGDILQNKRHDHGPITPLESI